MKTISLFFLCLLPAIILTSCNENASTPGFEDPTDPNLAPRVVWIWLESSRSYYRYWEKPTAGADTLPVGYYPGRLLIRFNKIMVGHTVIPNVTLLPADPGCASISYSGSATLDGQTFEFPIYGLFKVARTYTVSVGEDATDATGWKLGEKYMKELLPEPALRVINTYPVEGDTSVIPGQTIYFYLNAPVDMRTIAGNFAVEPPTSGKWYQPNYSRSDIYFVPDSGFRSNSSYKITLMRGIADSSDNHLQNEFSLRFRTLRFQVQYTYPYGGQQNVPINESVQCVFSSGIDTNSAKQNFQITPDISGSYQFPDYQPMQSFIFNPTTSLAPNTTYTVTLGANFRSQAGDLLQSPYFFSFTTSP